MGYFVNSESLPYLQFLVEQLVLLLPTTNLLTRWGYVTRGGGCCSPNAVGGRPQEAINFRKSEVINAGLIIGVTRAFTPISNLGHDQSHIIWLYLSPKTIIAIIFFKNRKLFFFCQFEVHISRMKISEVETYFRIISQIHFPSLSHIQSNLINKAI